MPPKRKQPDTTQAAPAPSTRSTRASTRAQKKEEDVPQPTKKKAPAKKAPKSAAKEVDDKADAVIATEEPPAKRAKITKSTTPAAKAKRGKAITALDDASVLKDKPESSTAIETPPSIELKKAPKVTLAKTMYSEAAAAELFTTYADPDEPQVIGPEGLEKFCTEADIPMEGALPILLSWQLNAQEMGRLEKAGWTKWTTERKLSSLPIIKLSLEELNDLLIDNKAPVQKPSKKTDEPYDRSTYWQYTADPKDAFHKLYFYSFGLVKTPQSRNIDMETAKAFWTVLLAPKYTLMSEVLQFINDREGAYKAVNKDLWSMMLEFCETMNPNLDGYEADGAWPTLLDEFVAHKKGAE